MTTFTVDTAFEAIITAARQRRLHTKPNGFRTPAGNPVLYGWKRLDEFIDRKLVGTDPTGQAWVIERIDTPDSGYGPVTWLLRTVEQFEFGNDVWGSYSSRAEAIDAVSNAAAGEVQ